MTSTEQDTGLGYADKQYIIDGFIELEVLEGKFGGRLNAPRRASLERMDRSELEALYKELGDAKTLLAVNQMIAKAITVSDTARRAAEAEKDAHIRPATISMEL